MTNAQKSDAPTAEEIAHNMWAGFFGMADTHNKGLHDGYHVGWNLGFDTGRVEQSADTTHDAVAPTVQVTSKNLRYDEGFSIGYLKGFEMGLVDGLNTRKQLAAPGT